MRNKIMNIASYRFVGLSAEILPRLERRLSAECDELALKGTILLSQEGINLFLAGEKPGVGRFWRSLTSIAPFSGMQYKESQSDRIPFRRMRVKIKREIIPFGSDTAPADFQGKRVLPRELKQWLDQSEEVNLLDTRNDFEVHLGTFAGATHLGISSFRDFARAAAKMPPELKERPTVLFCTGGIRCEKAAPFLEKNGFRHILQLEGGILKYFEACGGAHYNGECFVFDDRVAVDEQLQETGTVLCDRCQFPVTRSEQRSEIYLSGNGCRNCGDQ